MSAFRFRVWVPNDGDRPEGGPNVAATSASEAAETFVLLHWSDLDHPDTVDVIVETETGARHSLTVTAQRDVSFCATPTVSSTVDLRAAIDAVERLPIHAAEGVAYVNRQSVVHELRKLEKR